MIRKKKESRFPALFAGVLILLMAVVINTAYAAAEEFPIRGTLSKDTIEMVRSVETENKMVQGYINDIYLTDCESEKGLEPFMSPLYISIIVHSEEDIDALGRQKENIPDYDGDEELMSHFAMALRELGELVAEHGARINFGMDWTFSDGAKNFEPTFYTDVEAMGHEVDAHAHESHVYYPEVRQRIRDAGGSPTHVASGVNEDKMTQQMRLFDKIYPDFTILWGGGIPGHPTGECAAGWVWRPSRNDWTKHDPNGKYIFIGPGEYTNNIQFIRVAIKNRKPNQFNTYALLITPRQLLALEGAEGIDEKWTVDGDDEDYWENRLVYWDNLLSEIDFYVEKGVAEYASLTEIAGYYESNEDNINPDFGEIPRTRMSKMMRALLYE